MRDSYDLVLSDMLRSPLSFAGRRSQAHMIVRFRDDVAWRAMVSIDADTWLIRASQSLARSRRRR